MYLNSTVELKDYIFRKLGSEIHEVEVTDTQWLDILNDSFKEFVEYSSDGSIELISRVTLDSNVYKLSDNVLNIKKIFKGTSSSSIDNMFGSEEYYLPISLSDIYTSGGSDSILDNIISTKQNLANIRNVLNIELDFNFNPETKKLVIQSEDFAGEVIFIGDVAEDITEVLNNKYFKLMLEARTLRQWSRNISLKYDTDNASIIGNGLKLNPQGMRDEATLIEDEIKEGLESDEYGTLLTPRKLYQY